MQPVNQPNQKIERVRLGREYFRYPPTVYLLVICTIPTLFRLFLLEKGEI